MKVYLVWIGEYSDHKLLGVFSTEERANDYAAPFSDASVEEMDVDAQRDVLPGCFEVTIDQKGEVAASMWLETVKPTEPPQVLTGQHSFGKTVLARCYRGYGIDEETARRSADELRRQTVAVEGFYHIPPGTLNPYGGAWRQLDDRWVYE